MAPTNAFRLRWKGAVTGPFPLARVQELLRAGEISLLHNIEVDGVWMTLRDYLRGAGLTRVISPSAEIAPGEPSAERDDFGAVRQIHQRRIIENLPHRQR